MAKVTILCGISGSGKSTYAESTYAKSISACNYSDQIHVSADNYFTDEFGDYNFDATKLPLAHGACLREYVEWLENYPINIVVDNTNTTVVEVAPYAALALAYGQELEIIEIGCDVETALARNVHGVPRDAIEAQANRLESLEKSLPAWWPYSKV